MTSAIERAAGAIRQAMTLDGKAQAPDWFLIVDLVRDVVRALMLGCAPNPAAGYDYLTREFSLFERLLGAGRRRERRIRRAIARHWRGPADQLAEVQAAVLAGISWRLNRTMLYHLYAECSEGSNEQTRGAA
jgi:hypothetical protein